MELTSELPIVSIVMPVWNKDSFAAYLCRRAIASIVNYTGTPFELIIVNNASPCGDLAVDCKDLLDRIPHRVHYNESNRGFGPACNQGLKRARGEYFCQMNTDCELVEDSITMLIGAMRLHDLDVAMPEHFENCMAYGMGKSDELMSNWKFGAFYVARTEALLAVDGYDEDFQMCYWEDTDLWRRMEKAGFRIAGWRGTWVSHWGGASAHPERDRYFQENREKYAQRVQL
jgi:GT2 family glycosyltransferase